MNPQEFHTAWTKALPRVTEIIQRVRRDSPLDGDTPAHAGVIQRRNRWRCLYESRGDIMKALDDHGLRMFDSLPQWLNYEDNEDTLVGFIRRASRYVSCQDEALSAVCMPRPMKLVRIDAPAWFKNPEFVEWLKSNKTATWHGGADEPHDYSDVFFTFCQGEGSDWPGTQGQPGIPDEIWQHLEFMIAEQHGWEAEVLVWVSNLQ